MKTGLFGAKSSFVPLAGAALSGEVVRLAVDKARVNDAPGIEPDAELSFEEETRLFRHYGVPYDESGTVTAQGTPGGGEQDVEHEPVGPGRARLRRYVLEGQPVSEEAEEAPVEPEPNGDGATDGAATSKVKSQM